MVRKSNPNPSLDSDGELLVEPDRDHGVLLQELEDEINRWEKHFASSTTAAASVHVEVGRKVAIGVTNYERERDRRLKFRGVRQAEIWRSSQSGAVFAVVFPQ